MKNYIHNINKCDIENNQILFYGLNGIIKISFFEKNIIHFDYIFEDIEIDPLLLKGRQLFCENEIKPFFDLYLEEIEDIYHIHFNELLIKIEKKLANISVYKNNILIHGGSLGNSDTVIPDYQLRCISSNNNTNLFGKFNFPLESNAHFYGLGDKGGIIERNNKIFRFFNKDSLGYDAETSDPLYKSIPFFIKEKDSNFTGFLFDECDIDYMDFGKESPFFYSVKINGGPFSYYLIDGEDYKDVLSRYYTITGKSIFPPLFSFGFLGSSMNYVESDDAQERIINYFNNIEKYNIPCEGMYVSSGYLKAKDGKRYAFLWNKEKFPDYEDFLNSLSNKGYNLIMNIKPGILTTHPWYDDLASKGYFIKDKFDKPYVEFYWGGNASLIDFSNKEAKAWWKEELKKQYLYHGSSGIWNDNNEFEIEDIEIPVSKIKSMLPNLMSQAAYESFEEVFPSKRAWNYSRSGNSGIQKYARTWSGDNCSDFKSLKYNQFQSISMSLSGLTFYGHDLGGFFGKRPSEELLIRSCESAVFQSRFVIHSWREDDIPTEPWTYKNALDKIRNLINAHYSFIPYIYNTAYQAVVSGKPVDRSLKLEFYNDLNCKVDDVNSMFGDDILKILYVNENEFVKSVYLPNSTNWYSKDGTFYEGGTSIEVFNELGDFKYFVREGSLIATTTPQKLKSSLFEKVFFTVYPIKEGFRDGSYFEDDGETKLKYKKYNLYNYRVFNNKVEFKLSINGNTLENREFIFLDPKGNLIRKINIKELEKGESITILL